MFLSFLKQVTWKSPHFIFYLYNNSAMLIPQWNFQNWIPKWRSCVTYYGCSFVAKFSKWLLYSKKIDFRCLGNDFFMFIKRFSYSMNDFYMVNKWFSLSENDFYMFNKWFYIQQEIYIFSSLNSVFSNMRFIFNNLRLAFSEIKFIKLKPFIFSKPNLDATKYTIKSIRQNQRSGL